MAAVCLPKQCAEAPKLGLRIRNSPVQVNPVWAHRVWERSASVTLHHRLTAADWESHWVHKDFKVRILSGDFGMRTIAGLKRLLVPQKPVLHSMTDSGKIKACFRFVDMLLIFSHFKLHA